VVGKSSSAGSVRDSNRNWFSHPPTGGGSSASARIVHRAASARIRHRSPSDRLSNGARSSGHGGHPPPVASRGGQRRLTTRPFRSRSTAAWDSWRGSQLCQGSARPQFLAGRTPTLHGPRGRATCNRHGPMTHTVRAHDAHRQ